MAGPLTGLISATWPRGTWVPLGAGTGTLARASGWREYAEHSARARESAGAFDGQRQFVSPTAVSMTSWMAPTVMP